MSQPLVIYYTALFGKQATLKEFDTQGVPFICFTDDPNLKSRTWHIVHRQAHGDPRLDAKWFKMAPDAVLTQDLLTSLRLPPEYANYNISIWIDASISPIDVAAMTRACTDDLIDKCNIAFFKHPERDNIYDEVVASLPMPKYAAEPLQAQAGHYKASGLPQRHGLWAGGVIARWKTRTEYLGMAWYEEILRWSIQDQISLPYVLWQTGTVPGIIPGSVYGTDFHEHNWSGPLDLPKLTRTIEPLTVLNHPRPDLIVIDDFLEKPDDIRALALQQKYEKMGSAGKRSLERFHHLVDPTRIEAALGRKIQDWGKHDISGRFQFCIAEDPLVFHSDSQSHALMVFLTPDAPQESGLSLVRSKATGHRRDPSDPKIASTIYDGNHFDPTKWETIDKIGNVYNRAIIWDGKMLHAPSCYFGNNIQNGRLFWMFFFDAI
jgi:Protein of unknown function (DUF616)